MNRLHNTDVTIRYFLIVGFILTSWLVGCLITTRPLEKTLQKAALDVLSDLKYQHAFDQVAVSFAGQEATLTGKVIDQETKDLAEKIILHEIRIKDQYETHNPVTCVHNRLLIDDSTLPRPWIIVSLFEGKYRIDGMLADPTEKLALFDALASQLPTATRNDQCVIDPKSVSSKNWTATLANLPDFVSLAANKTGHAARVIAATTGNGEWKTFPHDITNGDVAKSLIDSKVSESLVEFALNSMRTASTAPVTLPVTPSK